MLESFRISSAVSSITNQKYAVDPNQDYKAFARSMADRIMGSYRDDGAELKGLSIRRQAVRLTTDVLISLEYDYQASIGAETEDADAANLLTTIEWLRECLIDFGQMYGEQRYVAECLARHENVLHSLLGESVASPSVFEEQEQAKVAKSSAHQATSQRKSVS